MTTQPSVIAMAATDLVSTANVITMRDAAQLWLRYLLTRRRNPAKPATIATFQSHIHRHIAPRLGHLEVGAVGVGVLRRFIADLGDAGLSPKTQTEISSCVKQIIASVVDSEGEPMFPRTWDNDRLDLPIVNSAQQRTPIVTREQIQFALANSNETYQCLFALASSSGMRLGELRAVKLTEDGISTVFDAPNAIIHVRQSVWRNQIQIPKTPASIRDVLLPYDVARFVAQYAGRRKGFLFGGDGPICESTAREQLRKHFGGVGYHAFRRFFVSHRRAMAMSNDLIKALVGHASSDITDRYSRFGRNPAYAAQVRAEVERVGCGFTLPTARRLHSVAVGSTSGSANNSSNLS